MALDQLVEPLYEKTGYSRAEIRYILSKLGESILDVLKKDEKVQIAGFGTFSVKVMAARDFHNPQEGGEKIRKEERKIVHFKVSPQLRKAFQK